MTGGTCQHSTSNRLRRHGFIIQILNHYLVFQVDFIIIFGMAAILFLLTVPAHHYKRRLLNCRNTRQNRIKQKKRVRIKRPGCTDILLSDSIYYLFIGHITADIVQSFS